MHPLPAHRVRRIVPRVALLVRLGLGGRRASPLVPPLLGDAAGELGWRGRCRLHFLFFFLRRLILQLRASSYNCRNTYNSTPYLRRSHLRRSLLLLLRILGEIGLIKIRLRAYISRSDKT